MIGDMYVVTRDFPPINVKAGEVGYVYEEYTIGEGDDASRGISIIFRNGGYDGWSEEDQKYFLVFIKQCPEFSGYTFTNVNRLVEDYRKGYWNFP